MPAWLYACQGINWPDRRSQAKQKSAAQRAGLTTARASASRCSSPTCRTGCCARCLTPTSRPPNSRSAARSRPSKPPSTTTSKTRGSHPPHKNSSQPHDFRPPSRTSLEERSAGGVHGRCFAAMRRPRVSLLVLVRGDTDFRADRTRGAAGSVRSSIPAICAAIPAERGCARAEPHDPIRPLGSSDRLPLTAVGAMRHRLCRCSGGSALLCLPTAAHRGRAGSKTGCSLSRSSSRPTSAPRS